MSDPTKKPTEEEATVVEKKPEEAAKMDEKKFISTIWDFYQYAHDRNGPLREEVYKIFFYKTKKAKGAGTSRTDEAEEVPPLDPDDPQDLLRFAKEAVKVSRDFGEATQKLEGKDIHDLLTISTRAGVLLSYVEQLMLGYDQLTQEGHRLSNETRVEILVAAKTTAATARDQIIAASGLLANSKEEIGSDERSCLLYHWLLPIAAMYLGYHFTLNRYGWLIPSQSLVFWEVLFWSLFGAIAKSLLSIEEDIVKDTFDPRHFEKYEFKIAVAPFVAGALIAFVSLFGFTYVGTAATTATTATNATATTTPSATTIQLDLANPNFAAIILLSFIFGFSAKRSIELLNTIWVRLFPPSQAQGEKEVSEAD